MRKLSSNELILASGGEFKVNDDIDIYGFGEMTVICGNQNSGVIHFRDISIYIGAGTFYYNGDRYTESMTFGNINISMNNTIHGTEYHITRSSLY